MKKFLYTFILLLSLSCSKDDDVTKPSAIISFTSDQDIKAMWIVVSDKTGKVLDWSPVSKNVKASLNYETDGSDNYTLTVIRKFSDTDNSLSTFTDVAPGDYFYKTPSSVDAPPITGVYTLNWDGVYQFSLDSDNYCSSQYIGPGKFELNVCGSVNHLYASTTYNDGIPKYLLKEMTAGGSSTLTDDVLKELPKMEKKVIGFNQPVSEVIISVNGQPTAGKPIMVYSNFVNDEISNLPIYYPVIPTYLKSLSVGLTYLAGEKTYFAFNRKIFDESVKFDEINANLVKVNSNTLNKISFELNGVAQTGTSFLHHNATGGQDKSFDWVINFPFSSSIEINLPRFPDNLLKEMELNFSGTDAFSQITFLEDLDLSSYKDYYQQRLKFDGSHISMENGRSKTYILN